MGQYIFLNIFLKNVPGWPWWRWLRAWWPGRWAGWSSPSCLCWPDPGHPHAGGFLNNKNKVKKKPSTSFISHCISSKMSISENLTSDQGWEFAHRISERIARFMPKNERMSHSIKNISDALIRSFPLSDLRKLLMVAHFWWATWAIHSHGSPKKREWAIHSFFK